jgi:serine/threonine-protein kinase
VRGVGSDRLETLDALLQSALRTSGRRPELGGAAERSEVEVPVPAATPSAPRATGRRRAALFLLFGAIAAAATLGTISLALRRAGAVRETRATDPSARAEARASAADLEADAATAPSAEAAATPTTVGSTPADPPPARPTPTARAHGGRHAVHVDSASRPPPSAVPSATGARCDPPYSIDAQGIKVYRPECVAH